jgi:hypothetical protein
MDGGFEASHLERGSFHEAYPALAPLLATPCDFVIYHKRLDL